MASMLFQPQQDPIVRQAQQNALPSVTDRETASNRLQSRLAAQTQGQNRQLQNQFAGAGRTGGGGFRQGVLQNNASQQNALASGLSDIELGFNQSRQQGANILSGLALGGGRLQNEGVALQEAERRNKANEAINFFNSFIEGGNLASSGSGRGANFDTDFQRLLGLIFGRLG